MQSQANISAFYFLSSYEKRQICNMLSKANCNSITQKSYNRGKQKDVAVFQPRPKFPSLLKGRVIDDGNKTSLGKSLVLPLIFPESRCSTYGCTDHDCHLGNRCIRLLFREEKIKMPSLSWNQYVMVADVTSPPSPVMESRTGHSQHPPERMGRSRLRWVPFCKPGRGQRARQHLLQERGFAPRPAAAVTARSAAAESPHPAPSPPPIYPFTTERMHRGGGINQNQQTSAVGYAHLHAVLFHAYPTNTE